MKKRSKVDDYDLGGFIIGTLATLTRLEPVSQTDRSRALALVITVISVIISTNICQLDRSSGHYDKMEHHNHLKADELLIADGLVGFEDGWGATGSSAVAVRLVATTVVLATLVPNVEPTVTVAAGTLKGGFLRRF